MMGDGTADVGNVQLKLGDAVEYRRADQPHHDLGWVTKISGKKVWVYWLMCAEELWVNTEDSDVRKIY